jgi:hypothetical protein
VKRYKIAAYLPLGWRRVMVEGGPYAATWPWGLPPEELEPGEAGFWPAPRNPGGYCPLGVLYAAGLVYYYPDAHRAPTPTRAARALAEALGQPEEKLFPALADFMSAWDAGEIADLAVALGLRVPRPVEDA